MNNGAMAGGGTPSTGIGGGSPALDSGANSASDGTPQVQAEVRGRVREVDVTSCK